ncbi:MAG: M23 family metallopeptidase [Gammaproteobacteria bacterium]|nr:M23 family metallopeptidase [Gammaproteobacteria bacterium]
MDLYANAGDPVVAMADGVVTAVQSFHLGSWAMFVDHGPVTVMYGEIEKNSWRDYGARVGTRVRAGQQIARVACMNWEGNRCVSHMLHLETYRPGTKKNKRWYRTERAPQAVLDPTWMILQARGQ